MNSICLLIVLFLEVMMVLQCLQIAFKKEIRLDKYTVGMVLIDVSLYMLINMKMIPAICALVLYVLLFIYCYIEYKQTIVKTIVGFVIGFVLVGCIEGVLAFVSNFFKSETNSDYILVILNVIALVASNYAKWIILQVKYDNAVKYNRETRWVIILLATSIIVLLVDYYCVKKLVNIYVVCVLFFWIMILFYLYRLDVARNEIEKKNYELELQRIYGRVYENLIAEVRRRQHDFKNQLGAIYSMHLVATSLEELVDMQNEYGNNIRYDSKFDSILTSCNNPILAGYLYHRCMDCEQKGILVYYNMHIDQAECSFQVHEIIEVLGILIDNACESFAESLVEHKKISIECLENDAEIILCISNLSSYIAYSDIEKMFDEGFSTKQGNRGIGLTRVLELTKKFDAELKVSNEEYDGENWLEFHIRIKK